MLLPWTLNFAKLYAIGGPENAWEDVSLSFLCLFTISISGVVAVSVWIVTVVTIESYNVIVDSFHFNKLEIPSNYSAVFVISNFVLISKKIYPTILTPTLVIQY